MMSLGKRGLRGGWGGGKWWVGHRGVEVNAGSDGAMIGVEVSDRCRG